MQKDIPIAFKNILSSVWSIENPSNRLTILKLDSHLAKKDFYLFQWKPFKKDEKCLFHPKNSFPLQDI